MNKTQNSVFNVKEQANHIFLDKLVKELGDSGKKVVPQYLCSAPSIRCEKNKTSERKCS